PPGPGGGEGPATGADPAGGVSADQAVAPGGGPGMDGRRRRPGPGRPGGVDRPSDSRAHPRVPASDPAQIMGATAAARPGGVGRSRDQESPRPKHFAGAAAP